MAFATARVKRQRMSPSGTAAAVESQAISQSRALVPIVLARRPSGRAHADFLAHLIATRREVPQTRARRRAEPGEVARVYRAALARPAPRPVLSRSL